MIGKRTLREVRDELTKLLAKLPAGNRHSWLEREIQQAEGQTGRDVDVLKMLQAALKTSSRKTKKQSRLAKR
jgi:hypothetical protein